jgi:hypothetical protein
VNKITPYRVQCTKYIDNSATIAKYYTITQEKGITKMDKTAKNTIKALVAFQEKLRERHLLAYQKLINIDDEIFRMTAISSLNQADVHLLQIQSSIHPMKGKDVSLGKLINELVEATTYITRVETSIHIIQNRTSEDKMRAKRTSSSYPIPPPPHSQSSDTP